MSEAPERIWVLHYECEDEPDAIAIGYQEKFFGAHEYVHADLIEELEAEVARLRQLVPRPDQTEDELVWRDHMRGVPLAALAKEFGVTKERMRHRLKRIAENKLHLKGKDD